jgi:hypothetical protein
MRKEYEVAGASHSSGLRYYVHDALSETAVPVAEIATMNNLQYS